jgi:hypothetical protein
MFLTLPIGLVIFIVGFTNSARNKANRNR